MQIHSGFTWVDFCLYLVMLVTEIQLYEALKEKIGEEQAKAITSYVEAKFDSQKDFLATKGDIKVAVSEVKTEIISSKVDILRWMIGTMLAVAGLIIAAFKLF